jgi:glycyl-tRNA synthetase
MTDSNNTQQLQDDLDALNAQITKQGSHVRQLKKDAGSADDIGEAVKALQALKIQASSVSDVLDKDTVFFNRKVFDDVTLRKMFIVPSFEIHGGVKGLFDLGPPATALKVCKFDSTLAYDVHARASPVLIESERK